MLCRQVMHTCPPDDWQSIGEEWDPGSSIANDGRSFFYHKWSVTVMFVVLINPV